MVELNGAHWQTQPIYPLSSLYQIRFFTKWENQDSILLSNSGVQSFRDLVFFVRIAAIVLCTTMPENVMACKMAYQVLQSVGSIQGEERKYKKRYPWLLE